MFNYSQFTARNSGYIDENCQDRLKTMNIVLAGCGMGSSIAISLVRSGAQNFTLIDGDRVELSNLNRQFYVHTDIGSFKTHALAKHMKSINPDCTVRTCDFFLDAESIQSIPNPKTVDLVIDCIDFMDVAAIQALHSHFLSCGVPVLSVMNIGFGAGAMYFTPESGITFRDILGIPADKQIDNADYIRSYSQLVERMAAFLDEDVITVFQKTFHLMAEGKPCPASQIAAGGMSCGALAPYLIRQILTGQPIPTAPEFITYDMNGLKSHNLRQ